MIKTDSLRQHLADSVATLKNNPENLHIFIDHGKIISTYARSLSFEYQYTLNAIITDYAGHADNVFIPLLEWVRMNQPDILANSDKRQNGITFEVDILNHSTCDISINIQLTERVIVKSENGQNIVTHLPEPSLPEIG